MAAANAEMSGMEVDVIIAGIGAGEPHIQLLKKERAIVILTRVLELDPLNEAA